MIEIDALVEPGDCQISLIGIKKGLVDRLQILESTLLCDEFVGWIDYILITGLDAEGEPSLLDLWVHSSGEAVVLVDLFKHGYRGILLLENQLL